MIPGSRDAGWINLQIFASLIETRKSFVWVKCVYVTNILLFESGVSEHLTAWHLTLNKNTEYKGVFNEMLNLLTTKGLKQNCLKIQYHEPHKLCQIYSTFLTGSSWY